MQKKIEEILKSEYPGYKLIYLTVTGSKLFGLDTASSDTDYMGIFIPSKEAFVLKEDIDEICLDTNPENKNSKDDLDIKLFSLEKFLNLLTLKGDGGAFDILFSMFSNKVIYETKESLILKSRYKDIICNKAEGFVGFAYKQASKYSVKGDRLQTLEDVIKTITDLDLSKKTKIKEAYPTLKEKFKDNYLVCFRFIEGEGEYISVLNRMQVENATVSHYLSFLDGLKSTFGSRAQKAKDANGLDYKAFSHAIRATVEAKELITTGFITLPLKEADRAFIKDVKIGKYKDIKYLSNLMDERVDELLLLKKDSILPNQVDQNIIREIKVEIYKLSIL